MNSAHSRPPYSPGDVRMRGFARRATVAEALAWLDGRIAPLPQEKVALEEGHGRVLASDIQAELDVPQFARSMMDGFAVRAADTAGAAPYNRRPLEIVGETFPGDKFPAILRAGEAIRIMTGAPVPDGADAVLPAEKAEMEGHQLFALDEVPPGKHVGAVGEDVARGTTVLRAGRKLRPQDLGVLSSIGCGEVPVVRQPRVRIVITGDELLPPGTRADGYKIADANGPMLRALSRRDGAVVGWDAISADRPDAILQAMRDDADIVLVSGGSSVGQEDHAPSLLRDHGELAIHGVAMRPSSPAGMGLLDGRLVLLLPGNPVSCLCAYDFFAGRAIRALGGRSRDWPYRRRRLRLRRKLVSVVGRLDYARVKLVDDEVEPLATSGASILSSTTRADGFVLVPSDYEGYPPGAEVDVYLYDDEPA